ncbi:hypothetical protein V2J09_011900 [Rumex salicifolius]
MRFSSIEEQDPIRSGRKRIRLPRRSVPDPFDILPDDLVICILSKLCSSSSSPSDFVNAHLVCKRFNQLGVNPLVLSKASSEIFSIKAKKWSDSAHRFVKRCVDAGSVEACYFLGMIRFYCLGNRGSGASLMAKAAIRCHAPALYSLAVIQFNGSGGNKTDKDLRAGVALCARAASLGHVDACKELGHCLQDGYGVRRNVVEGRRLLVQANARELAVVLKTGSVPGPGFERGLLSDFGCNVPELEPRPINRFLVEWFGSRNGLSDPGICSHSSCGRPETRPHEFRRCSVCGAAKYCSRGCQARDWKLRHKSECTPTRNAAGGDYGDFAVADGHAAEDVVLDS